MDDPVTAPVGGEREATAAPHRNGQAVSPGPADPRDRAGVRREPGGDDQVPPGRSVACVQSTGGRARQSARSFPARNPFDPWQRRQRVSRRVVGPLVEPAGSGFRHRIASCSSRGK